MTDDPSRMVGVAHRMAEFGSKDRTHPWWALAASVEALATIVTEDQPLAEPARVALQIMATLYNERVGDAE